MTVSLVSLGVGLFVGYLGQRSRMCTIGGLRDFVLVRDTGLLKGVAAMLITAWLAFGAIRLISGSSVGHGFIATLSGACPLRQHVLAGQGRIGTWSFLAGFYLAAVVYTSWISPHIASWVL